ncbi:MAG TPA: hotdog fold domain-containing protein [Dehalococcoidia bacterium]|jgi:acyl-coenzyme A thioesterase PaaI-like protein|nr:hotdog fold domain-containing protein [Dehalococcoidia bacterium]
MPDDPDYDPALLEHYCFGCGRHNPIGLHLAFQRDGDGMTATYLPRPEDQGFPGIMHGGLLGLVLDEAMGWAMYADELFAVTAKMETRFRRQVGLDAPLTVHSRITRRRGRRIELQATVSDEGGDVLVEGSGLFVRMPAEQEAAALATFRPA